MFSPIIGATTYIMRVIATVPMNPPRDISLRPNSGRSRLSVTSAPTRARSRKRAPFSPLVLAIGSHSAWLHRCIGRAARAATLRSTAQQTPQHQHGGEAPRRREALIGDVFGQALTVDDL